jgi:hypothetical protein
MGCGDKLQTPAEAGKACLVSFRVRRIAFPIQTAILRQAILNSQYSPKVHAFMAIMKG